MWNMNSEIKEFEKEIYLLKCGQESQTLERVACQKQKINLKDGDCEITKVKSIHDLKTNSIIIMSTKDTLYL